MPDARGSRTDSGRVVLDAKSCTPDSGDGMLTWGGALIEAGPAAVEGGGLSDEGSRTAGGGTGGAYEAFAGANAEQEECSGTGVNDVLSSGAGVLVHEVGS